MVQTAAFQFGDRLVWVEDRHRPLRDSRYGTLRAGKLPFIKDGAHFARRLAGLGMSLLVWEEDRRTDPSHACPCTRHLPTSLSVCSRTHVTKTSPPSSNQMVLEQTCPYNPWFRKAPSTSTSSLLRPTQANWNSLEPMRAKSWRKNALWLE